MRHLGQASMSKKCFPFYLLIVKNILGDIYGYFQETETKIFDRLCC